MIFFHIINALLGHCQLLSKHTFTFFKLEYLTECSLSDKSRLHCYKTGHILH